MDRYFEEVARSLKREGFDVGGIKGGELAVGWKGAPLCRIVESGGVRYRASETRGADRETACVKASRIAHTVAEYCRALEHSPPLVVPHLADGYKLLAEFGGTVLAGRYTQHGSGFVTWDRSYAQIGLVSGHYYDENGYEAAKRDFIVRSGLVDRDILFSNEQLAEMYRCVDEMLDSGYPITNERCKLLEEVLRQIRRGVPEIYRLVEQSYAQEQLADNSMDGGNLVGILKYANGEVVEYQDAEEFIRDFKTELEYRATTGMEYELCTDDPHIRKSIDDALYNMYGEDNPRSPEDYERPSPQGGGMDNMSL